MRRRYPLTYAYLKRFERELADRPDRKYYPEGAPFYTMRNVASYTRSSWKVVFKDLSEVLECLVVGPQSLGEDVKPVFPDLTLRLIPVASEAEAHFVAGLLNSSPSILLLHASSVGVQTQRYHPGDIGKIGVCTSLPTTPHLVVGRSACRVGVGPSLNRSWAQRSRPVVQAGRRAFPGDESVVD